MVKAFVCLVVGVVITLGVVGLLLRRVAKKMGEKRAAAIHELLGGIPSSWPHASAAAAPGGPSAPPAPEPSAQAPSARAEYAVLDTLKIGSAVLMLCDRGSFGRNGAGIPSGGKKRVIVIDCPKDLESKAEALAFAVALNGLAEKFPPEPAAS